MGKIAILDIQTFEHQDELTNFYCNIFRQHLKAHREVITVPHKHDFFLTVLFTQGSGIHEIDFEKYTICPGSVFMLNPGQTHHWELSDDADGMIFFHSQSFFDIGYTNASIHDFPFFYSLLNPSVLFLSSLDADRILQWFVQIKNEYDASMNLSTQKIIALLQCVYIDLSRIYVNTAHVHVVKSGAYSVHLKKLEGLIEHHFKEQKSPAAYAEMMNMTIRHLNRLTQHSLNKSTTQLITERVLLEAKRMLVFATGSFAEVSHELGYEDYAYFSRVFRKGTGVTPSAFRQHNQSESKLSK